MSIITSGKADLKIASAGVMRIMLPIPKNLITRILRMGVGDDDGSARPVKWQSGIPAKRSTTRMKSTERVFGMSRAFGGGGQPSSGILPGWYGKQHRIIQLNMKPVRAQIRHLGFRVVRQTLRSLGVRPPRIVFIMGHMPSGTTLLLHLLISNPELIACGERNTAYRSADDLDKLEIAARQSQRSMFRQVSYVVDQINHDEFTPNPDLFKSERIRCI